MKIFARTVTEVVAEWMTNDPQVAAKLRSIERRYRQRRRAAEPLSLSAKADVLRDAKVERDAAIAKLIQGEGNSP